MRVQGERGGGARRRDVDCDVVRIRGIPDGEFEARGRSLGDGKARWMCPTPGVAGGIGADSLEGKWDRRGIDLEMRDTPIRPRTRRIFSWRGELRWAAVRNELSRPASEFACSPGMSDETEHLRDARRQVRLRAGARRRNGPRIVTFSGSRRLDHCRREKCVSALQVRDESVRTLRVL